MFDLFPIQLKIMDSLNLLHIYSSDRQMTLVALFSVSLKLMMVNIFQTLFCHF